MLNTTPTENLNHDYLQQLFQRHIERMSEYENCSVSKNYVWVPEKDRDQPSSLTEYKERLNNEMVHTKIQKDECPIYREAQASSQGEQSGRVE